MLVHNRKDLSPNVCAVYVEERYRCQGIAGVLLNYVCRDMRERGINKLYLLTEHTSFLKDMAGNSYVWYRGMEKKSCQECIHLTVYLNKEGMLKWEVMY